MIVVRRMPIPEPAALPGLGELLRDAVEGGASVGYLSPLAEQTARRHWLAVFAQLAHHTLLWVAEDTGRIVGSVQLELCAKENGRHRAEVQKLFVHSSHRGRGIGAQLLQALEAGAREQGRTLLVLDSLRGSYAAETLYPALGWHFVGHIPDYAAHPDGRLDATAVFYKRLD